MKTRFLILLVLCILLAGCGVKDTNNGQYINYLPHTQRTNYLPRPVYQLTIDGKPAGNVCWLLPFDNYTTNMEYKGWINVTDSRCGGWIRK